MPPETLTLEKRPLSAYPCPLCSGTAERFLTLRDWAYTGEGPFGYLRCHTCGAVLAEESIPPKDLGRYYPRGYAAYVEPQSISRFARAAQSVGIRKRRLLIERLRQGGRLLDVGCGRGDFLQAMQATGRWQASGLERDQEAVQIARARGLDVHHGEIPDYPFPPASFDVITLWDVLEHLEQPHRTVQSLLTWLQPGGILVIRTPDAASWQARLFGPWWAGYDAPRHRIIYTWQALQRLLKAYGLEVKRLRGLTGTWPLASLSLQNWARAHNLPPWFVKGIQHPFGQAISLPSVILWDAIAGGAELVVAAQRQERPNATP